MKNFIRGMGVGILITTMVLGIAYMLTGNQISDSEIRERAKKLGMVEASQDDILGIKKVTEDAVTQDTITAETLQQTMPSEDETEQVQPVISEEPVTVSEAVPQADEIQAIPDTAEKVTVTIKRGQDGVSISQMLQQQGVVADAADFTHYLSQNQLQMYILHGTFELYKNMPYEEIVKQIVRK